MPKRIHFGLLPVEKLSRLLNEGQLTDRDAEKMLEVIERRKSGATLLLNLKQAAEFVGVSTITLRRWEKQKLVKSVTLGKSRWFKTEDLKKTVAAF